MRWCLCYCIMLACIAASLATEDTKDRQKRDVALMKKLFKSILIGSHHVLNKITPSLEPPQKHYKGNIKVYQVPGYHNLFITEECVGSQRKMYLHRSLEALESYLHTPGKMLYSREPVNLLESGIPDRPLVSSPALQSYETMTLDDSLELKALDLKNFNRSDIKVFQVPGYPNLFITEECEGNQRKTYLHRSLEALESYLRTNTPKETLSDKKQGNLLESGIFNGPIASSPSLQGFEKVTQDDDLAFKPLDLQRPMNSYPYHPYYVYPPVEDPLFLSSLLSGDKKPEKFESPEVLELPLHIGGILENDTLELPAKQNSFEHLQNPDTVTDMPIPKPAPTLGSFQHIEDFDTELKPPASLPVSSISASKPILFEHKPIIPEAPIINRPMPEASFPAPPHIHPNIETEIKKFHTPPVESKYSYHQLNHDGSITSIVSQNEIPNVVVTKYQPKPIPSYIFNRFQWICSKFGITLAHSRPVSSDIPVIIPNPVIVHPYFERPIFQTPFNPKYRVPTNPLVQNLGWDAVNVKISKKNPEKSKPIVNRLPVNPIHSHIKYPELNGFAIKPQRLHPSGFMYKQVHGDGSVSNFDSNGVIVTVTDTKKPAPVQPLHGFPATIQMAEVLAERVHSGIPIRYSSPDNINKKIVENRLSEIKSIPKPPSFIVDRIEKGVASAHSVQFPKASSGYSFSLATGKGKLVYGDTLDKLLVENPENSADGLEESCEEDEDVKIDQRKLLTDIRTSGAQVSVVVKPNKKKTGSITWHQHPFYITERINQAAATAQSVKMPRPATGYSFSLVNGKSNIAHDNSLETITKENLKNKDEESKQNYTTTTDIIFEHKEDSTKTQNIISRKDSAGKLGIIDTNTHTNPGTLLVDNSHIFIPSHDAEEKTPFPSKNGFLYLDTTSNKYMFEPYVKSNIPVPSGERKSDDVKTSTAFLNANQVIFNEPKSSRYVYKQISHNNPMNITVVNVEDRFNGNKNDVHVHTYAHSNPSPQKIEDSLPSTVRVNPSPRFSYKVVSNENAISSPKIDDNSLLNNPIIVPDEKVTYTYNQNNIDGSKLTVHGDINNKVSVKVNRGDIPDY